MEYKYFRGEELSIDMLVGEGKLPDTLRFLESLLKTDTHFFTISYRIVLVKELIQAMVMRGKIRQSDSRYSIIDDFCRRNFNQSCPIYVVEDVIYTPHIN